MKYLVCLLVLALLCVATNAFAALYTEQYEMDYAPDTVQGTVWGHTLIRGGGSGTYGGGGMDFSGGVGTFLNDSYSNGNQGYYSSGSWVGDGNGNYTLDVRLKVLGVTQPAYPAGSKSFSVKGSNGDGRGLQTDPDGVCFVNGSGHIGMESGNDFTFFADYRIIVNGNVAGFYRMSDNVLLAQSTLGGSGAAGELGPSNFALGSLSGSGTTYAHFQLDWARVMAGATSVTDRYETWTPPATPEPGSVLALGSGLIAMAGLALRRRRA